MGEALIATFSRHRNLDFFYGRPSWKREQESFRHIIRWYIMHSSIRNNSVDLFSPLAFSETFSFPPLSTFLDIFFSRYAVYIIGEMMANAIATILATCRRMSHSHQGLFFPRELFYELSAKGQNVSVCHRQRHRHRMAKVNIITIYIFK